ncbi:MAG: right-handed parallel beta-helix repeat-containing protein [Rhodothermales bacterium]
MKRQAALVATDSNHDDGQRPALDERLNLIRTPEQQAAFDAHRAAVRLAALARIGTAPRIGRVRTDLSASTRAASARAAKSGVSTVFTVNVDFDDPDVTPGDGVCYDGFTQALGTIFECTLRAAIEEANATAGSDPIVIRIDMISPTRGASTTVAYDGIKDLWTVFPNTDAANQRSGLLPPLTRDNVLIDATTQLDGSGVGTFPDALCGEPVVGDTSIIKVAIDGSLLPGATDVALEIDANNVEIRGLAVMNAPGNGIYASGADNLKIECSYLGTDHFARTAAPNGSSGLAEQGGNGFHMKNSIASGNTLSGVVAASPGGAVDSSFFGLDVTGLIGLGNAATGLYVTGDKMSVTGIFASGNADGLGLLGDSAIVTNSVFGVATDLVTPVPNNAGIRVYGAGNRIGGPAGMRVLASGNTLYGISLAAEAHGNVIAGSLVGTDLTGTVAIPNQTGISDGGSGNMIGEEFIPLEAGLTGDPPGEIAAKTSVAATIPTSGGWSNLISGNSHDGITASGTSIIVGNYIGTDSLGTSAVPNGVYGVYLLNGMNHEVGRAPVSGNLISGNGAIGVYVGPLVSSATVKANYVGTDASGASSLPNSGPGIRADATGSVLIGGSVSAANIVAFNAGPGVRVDNTGPVTVRYNQIFDNGGLGIDLGGDGVTPNDSGTPPDTDTGPNGLQNYPIISNAFLLNPTTVSVAFDFESTPNTEFQFDYYRSATADGSGNGEGAVWLKTHTTSTDSNGDLGLGLGFDPADLPVGSWVTVTATNPSNETSEFSNAFQVTGSVITLDGAKVFLEGPYSSGSMNKALRSSGYIPLNQPYGDAAFNGTLQEVDASASVASIPVGVVDWVTLSLRTATDAASEVARRVAFLKDDGTLTDLDGTSGIAFVGLDSLSYYLVVCHRNHICAMSASAIDFAGGTGSWDFTTASTQAYSVVGAPMKALGDGNYGLFSSDANADRQVTALDFSAWIASTTAGETGYLAADFNMDGFTTALDFTRWIANTTAGVSCKVPL